MSLFRNLDLEVTNRQTYDLLQFLGDIGGLNSILMALGTLLVGSIAQFRANSFLL